MEFSIVTFNILINTFVNHYYFRFLIENNYYSTHHSDLLKSIFLYYIYKLLYKLKKAKIILKIKVFRKVYIV